MNYNFDENLEKNLIKYSQYIASNYYYYTFGKEINWNDPQNLNEKINWLAFNTDTRLWSVLADKYAVREYIKSKELDFLLNDIFLHPIQCVSAILLYSFLTLLPHK